MAEFIPSFHQVAPQKKLTPAWCNDAINYYWYGTANYSLLDGKNVKDIEGYASGDFSMNEFKRMFKSQAKAMDKTRDPNDENYNNNKVNTVGIGFTPLPLIPTKLNSAIATIQQAKIEVKATAQDSLAVEKKQQDLTFLKNKPEIEKQLQPIADQLNVGKPDLGTTNHSSVPYSDSPYGLDLTQPDELQVFVDIIYNLSVEASFETVLQEMWSIKTGINIKLLEVTDQFKFGVSCHRAFQSSMTSLPDIKYTYPGTVQVPFSNLPDYSDNSHRFITDWITPIELMNYVSDEICDLDQLDSIMNDKKSGYSISNNIMGGIQKGDFNNTKIQVVYCEVRSIDYVGVMPLNKKSKFVTFATDENDLEKCTNKIWGQNTYCFWWLKNTEHFFKIEKLPFAYRTIGKETFQNFSSNIYKSQKKSAVELSIGENKKAQIADIKLQHAVIKSLPSGKYINLKFLRGALGGLKEGDNPRTIDDLINLAMEQNWFIGDTEGFDGKNDGQLKPFEDIPGGLKTEIIGYMQVINDASQKISQFTGINDNLTGQRSEELVGNQQLQISAGINALKYVSDAIQQQYQKLFSNWATVVKAAVEKGGKAKEAIVNLIGNKKVSLIDALDEIPLHDIGIKITIDPRVEEKQRFEQELNRLTINGIIDTVDIYMLSTIENPKDKMALLAVRLNQWKKRTDKQRAEDQAQQQAMLQAQGQNQLAATNAKVQGDIQKIYAQGDTNSKILQLAAQLGVQDKQMDFLGKAKLQQQRGESAIDKNVQTLQAKSQIDDQKPYTS